MPNVIHAKPAGMVRSPQASDSVTVGPEPGGVALALGQMERTTGADVIERAPLNGRLYAPTEPPSILPLPQNPIEKGYAKKGSKLRILLLHDNRPGHYHQSEGIVAAIRRLLPVEVHRAEVKKGSILPRKFLYGMLNSGRISDKVIRYFSDRAAPLDQSPDLIVSAGGRTLLSNVLLAKRYGCENVFSGSLRDLKPTFFSAVLLQYPRFRRVPNYIIGLKPNPVDPDKPLANFAAAELCILVGGPSGTHRYTQSEWETLFSFIRDVARNEKVVALTSPRTPPDITKKLKDLASAIEEFRAIDFYEAGPGSAFQFCLAAKAICVTEDSNSMITEAVCARKPVIALAPSWRRLNEDEMGYLEDLEKLGWIKRELLDDRLSPDRVKASLELLRPMLINHLDLLAAQLARKLSNLQGRPVAQAPAYA